MNSLPLINNLFVQAPASTAINYVSCGFCCERSSLFILWTELNPISLISEMTTDLRLDNTMWIFIASAEVNKHSVHKDVRLPV